MDGSMIKLTSADGFDFAAYHIVPEVPRKGGLVLIQEIFGVNSDMRRAAERFAKVGYEVVAPSMFDRVKPGFTSEDHSPDAIAQAIEIAQQNDMDKAMADVGTCVSFLAPRGPVFITGYCYGGSIAWLSACTVGGLAASSAYYGSLLPSTADQTPKCPVIAHFGEKDDFIPMDGVEAFRHAQPDVPVYVYEAGHGFSREGSDDFHAHSDALAMERTLALFEANGAAS